MRTKAWGQERMKVPDQREQIYLSSAFFIKLGLKRLDNAYPHWRVTFFSLTLCGSNTNLFENILTDIPQNYVLQSILVQLNSFINLTITNSFKYSALPYYISSFSLSVFIIISISIHISLSKFCPHTHYTPSTPTFSPIAISTYLSICGSIALHPESLCKIDTGGAMSTLSLNFEF